jgi:chromosome partitioning protein
MAKIISIVNQKGGVGKTTSTVNLATYLAEAGKFVLLVDLDPQGNASSGLGVDIRNVGSSLYDAMVGGYSPQEYIVHSNQKGLDILPATPALAGANIDLVSMQNREFRLFDVLSQIRTQYDFILIDSPPSLGLLTVNGLVAADYVVIPVQAEYYALEGLSQLLETIELVRQNLQPDLAILGALITMYDRRNRLARQVVNEMRSNFPGHVFDSVIPRSVRLAEAPGFGKSILAFDRFSKGARAYRAATQEILERVDAV